MLRIIPLITAFLLFWSLPCQGLEIEFSPQVHVSGPKVTLADLVHFSDNSELAKALGTQILTQAPAPGTSITLNTHLLRKRLTSKLSLSPTIIWKGSSQVRVERDGLTIGPTYILAQISDFLRSHQDDLPQADISFIPKKLPLPFILPMGKLVIEVLPSNSSILSSSSFSLIFRVDGRVYKNISISGKLKALRPVAIATTTIKKGSLLLPHLVQMQTRDITGLRTPCYTLQEILGKRAKRTIKSGSVINLSKVEFPPLIRKGQLVKIIIQRGDMLLSATGIARMNGKKDQIIRVQNSSSKRLIHCRVAALGIVEVIL